jgi:hypothetical protein
LREALTEIKSFAGTDPVTAADGVVCPIERIWPAFQHIDTSSSAIGGAVNWTGRVVTHPDRGAREPENPRQMAGPPLASRPGRVNYLWIVEDRWGELCGSREVASHWADRLVGLLRTPRSDERPGSYVQGTSVCLSSLVAAGRQLLALRRFPFWHDCKFGVHVLLSQGRLDDALAFAEVLNQPNAALDVAARRYCSMPAE